MTRPSRLSQRVFLLVTALVTTCGVLVHLPGLIAFRTDYLEHRLIDAYMATIALRAGGTLTTDQQAMLLEQAHLIGIELQFDGVKLRLGAPAPVERDIMLSQEPLGQRLFRTLQALFDNGHGWLRVSGAPPGERGVWIAVTLDAVALQRAMRRQAVEALLLSVAISLFTASLVQLGLMRLVLRPIERLTAQLAIFHADPYHALPLQPLARADEIGELQRSLAAMEAEVQAALKRETRLAALGGAVARIHHDLKSILATVSFASARLADAADPRSRQLTELLAQSVRRAVNLCASTLDLARGESPVTQRERIDLAALCAQAAAAAARPPEFQVTVDVPSGATISGDPDRLARVLGNLLVNSREAGAGQASLTARLASADWTIDIADDGPGLPEAARARLFEPFVSSVKVGGNGLGLATSHDIARAHGGELELIESSSHGVCFRLTLPRVMIQTLNG
ncbi:MAG TPA: HAMP domain-containing sensor histidine kinase [Candidatus Competibacter sp.]|nr:HAMP domain-containing histidine kinase [Candidatus Competibacteraceae bacterium]HPE70694.1 HAMP domain-containing sensor histidine kinase [Candidatus Competibacter sp.]HRX71273.1 HAMP domain-containing sensor histidine kinase [Candidatus Competibacteraceae bacterium]